MWLELEQADNIRGGNGVHHAYSSEAVFAGADFCKHFPGRTVRQPNRLRNLRQIGA
jgi:hypothetical protein